MGIVLILFLFYIFLNRSFANRKLQGNTSNEAISYEAENMCSVSRRQMLRWCMRSRGVNSGRGVENGQNLIKPDIEKYQNYSCDSLGAQSQCIILEADNFGFGHNILHLIHMMNIFGYQNIHW